jgi:hypothetical protein
MIRGSKFESKYLLSDKDILAKGVSQDDVEAYRRSVFISTHSHLPLSSRDYYREQFGVDKWYDGLEEHTFRTIFVPLSLEEGNALLWSQREHAKTELKTSKIYKNDTKDMEAKYKALLQSLERRIDEAAKQFPGGFFIKLNTRSPKDAPIYQFRQQEMKDRLVRSYAELRATSEWDDNAETLVYLRTLNEVLRLTSGRDVLEIFRMSYRIHDDLSASTRWGESLFNSRLVLREWVPEVIERPQYEFRGFVHNRSLNALTQYFTCIHFPEIVQEKAAIAARVQTFFNDCVVSKIAHDHYIIDFVILQDRIIVIELNPFHRGAGAGLFSWAKHRELFMNGPFEIRVTMAPEQEPRNYIAPRWQSFIDATCLPRMHVFLVCFSVCMCTFLYYAFFNLVDCIYKY